MTAISETIDQTAIPFDTAFADRLMEEAGIDVLLATSRHNTRYLLGGYNFIFFSAMEAIGHSRYLPIVLASGCTACRPCNPPAVPWGWSARGHRA